MKFIWYFLVMAACASAQAETPSGRWDLTIAIDNLKVPFSMQLDFTEGAVSGAFTNGEEKVSSTQGTFREGVLRLTFRPNDTVLEAKIASGSLTGTYSGPNFGSYAVEGAAYCTCASEGEAGSDISGTWRLQTPGSASSTLLLERKGDDTIAHLLAPDDKTGALAGRFDGLAFMLHHFDGSRASLLELEPRPDGTLDVTLKGPHAAAKKFHATKAAVGPGSTAQTRIQ